jgi:cytochrome c-type biogenesis protein CcmH
MSTATGCAIISRYAALDQAGDSVAPGEAALVPVGQSGSGCAGETIGGVAMPYLTWTLVALVMAAPPVSDAALEREARQIETMLIAPCCWLQQVSEHRSQASDEVKQQIRVWLAAGNTRQQVLDAFVARYGKRILAEPPDEGFGRLLYVGLPLAFLLSAAALVVFIRRVTAGRAPPALATGSVPPDEADYAARLDDELRDLD